MHLKICVNGTNLFAYLDFGMSRILSSLLKIGKTRQGVPLLIVKEIDKVGGVVGYRPIIRIQKNNNAEIPRKDEMFDSPARRKVFSRLDLKNSFQKIRVEPIYIEITLLSTHVLWHKTLSMN